MEQVPVSGTDGASRLAAARAALALAEQRAGLHDAAARDVQRAMTRALDAAAEGTPAGSSGLGSGSARDEGLGTAGAAASRGAMALDLLSPVEAPWEVDEAGTDPWLGLGPDSAGALAVTGSRTVLLAAAARRQGRHGWCAVVGGEDLGWSAAAEAGLDLERLLVVPAAELSPSLLLAATSALLDGVDVLLVDAAAASRLRPRDRRTLFARARERDALILSDLPWEGARSLVATPQGVDTGEPGTDPHPAGATQSPGEPVPGDPAREGRADSRGSLALVHGLGKAPVRPLENVSLPEPEPVPELPAREMPAGYLRGLRWSLRDPARPGAGSRLELAPSGVSASLAAPVPEAPGPGATPTGAGLAEVVPLTRSRR
ncbi:hypothetical protein [Actinomyces haliotis]|uniref:hypothetical protein n=1 Tax=Actinomyces haliotis TaxID=1280843 RepID=UPI00188EFD4E|nr:hypothetical protein [Actinomyces haliotis]